MYACSLNLWVRFSEDIYTEWVQTNMTSIKYVFVHYGESFINLSTKSGLVCEISQYYFNQWYPRVTGRSVMASLVIHREDYLKEYLAVQTHGFDNFAHAFLQPLVSFTNTDYLWNSVCFHNIRYVVFIGMMYVAFIRIISSSPIECQKAQCPVCFVNQSSPPNELFTNRH